MYYKHVMDNNQILIIGGSVLALVIILILYFYIFSSPKYTFVERLDYPGNDIKLLDGATVEECEKECNSLANCAGFNRNRGTPQGGKGPCWIKNGTPNPTPTNDWNFYTKQK